MLALSESVTEVRTNIYVTSFGPVSDTDMVCVFFSIAWVKIRFICRRPIKVSYSLLSICVCPSTRYCYMYCNW